MAAARPPRRFPIPISNAAIARFAASMRDNLLNAAQTGDLRLLKRLVRMLDEGVGRPRDVVEAARMEQGIWALQVAAVSQQMDVCRYLVQDLRVDVDAADDKGRTPLFYAVNSENAAVVKYLLDHGADPDKADEDRRTPLFYAMHSENAAVVKCLLDHGADPDKADENGLSPLHSAAGIGDCKMIEMLLAKGAYVDPIADEIGTPLLLATKLQHAGAIKTLLEHNADPNKPYMMEDYLLYPMTPLFQAVNVSSLECVKLLVEAGAVITSDCVTTVSLDSTMGNDSSTECLNFLMEACARRDAPNDDRQKNAWKIEQLKSFGSQAVQRKDYFSASTYYTKAIDLDPSDATLFSNRSLCSLRQGNGRMALLDALECRELRPDWPKACYRYGAALMSLEEYGNACQAFLDGLKLEPDNAEMEHALREAMESLKTSKGSRVT